MTFYEHMAVCARTYLVGVLQQHAGRAYESMQSAGIQKDAFYDMLRTLGLKCEDFRPIRPHAICPDFTRWISRAVNRGVEGLSKQAE